MSINPSSPYYLLYLFIVDLSFTPGNIPALLFGAFGKQEDSKAQYLISPSVLTAFSAVTSVEGQLMTPKTSSIPSLPGCSLSALSGLSLFYLSRVRREHEDDEM